MLDGRDQEPVPWPFLVRSLDRRGERQHVRLAAARGENHVAGLGADQRCDLFARPLDEAAGSAALGMHGRGIPRNAERLRERGRSLRPQRRRGVPVEIAAFHDAFRGQRRSECLLFDPPPMLEVAAIRLRRRQPSGRSKIARRLKGLGAPPGTVKSPRRRFEPRSDSMPEVIFTGPAGRIEGRYHPARQKNAPIGIVLHPHPQFGGTMNHQIVYQLYYAFVHRNFAALRFNFRGVGRSQGGFDHGIGELSDAASALDWAQSVNPEARSCWIAGFSFGAWIGMQLLMRRPEIEGFISIAPPANLYDFSFLAPCPSSGLIIHGDKDAVVPHRDVTTLVEKLKTQKGIVIEQKVVPGANHFFDGKIEPLMSSVSAYLDKRLGAKGGRTTSAA
jgi:alpha/beta superfamily hydrolase